MELISQHNHTDMTNHGQGSIEELVTQAYEYGMSNIAITEHYPLTLHVDPRNYISMSEARLGEYKKRIRQQRTRFPSMEILIGCELDWLGEGEDRALSPESFQDFDIVLGSVHFLDLWPFDDPAQRGYWDEVGADYIWKRYFEVWCEAATSKAPFTVMSHPDLVKKFNRYPSFNLEPYYADAAEAARAGGRMVEVNTSGVTYACEEMFPHVDFLRAFCQAGVPCTIGSDAHRPADVARGIQDGYHLMYEAGYRKVTVVMPGGDRRSVPLERA